MRVRVKVLSLIFQPHPKPNLKPQTPPLGTSDPEEFLEQPQFRVHTIGGWLGLW